MVETETKGHTPDLVLEALQTLNHYVQSDWSPNDRSIEGGQYILDRGWDLITKSHAVIAAAPETAAERDRCAQDIIRLVLERDRLLVVNAELLHALKFLDITKLLDSDAAVIIDAVTKAEGG